MTEGLHLVKAVGLLEAGKAVDRLDMVRMRRAGRNPYGAAPTVEAIANQSLPFDVRAATPTFLLSEKVRFQFVVRGVVARSWPIRIGARIVGHRKSISKLSEFAPVVNTNGVPVPVFAQTLGGGEVLLAADGLCGNPEGVVVKVAGNRGEVVGDPKVVRPAANDG